MSLITTHAIVLRSQGLGDADKLVTLFTGHKGKVRGVAKGARRLRTRFGASLEPFTHCCIEMFERRPGVLMRINQTEILHSFMNIRQDLDAISAAARMVRLVSALTPDAEANSKIFDLLLKGLCHLEKNKKDFELITRFFEIHLLKYSGYLPKVDSCLKCNGVNNAGPIYFSHLAGGTICSSCHGAGDGPGEPVSKGTLAFLVLSLRMGWSKLDRMKATRSIRDELRILLEASITNIIGRPFSTSPVLEV
jgi:DNA repair protein RecO (recombination protein O)